MKKSLLFLAFIFSILSGFTYYQRNGLVTEVDQACENFLAGYANLSGLEERLIALKQSDKPSSGNSQEITEAEYHLRMIKMEADTLYKKISRRIEEKSKEGYNLLYWMKGKELEENYQDLCGLNQRIGQLIHNDGQPIPDYSESRNVLVGKLIKYFRNQSNQEIRIVYNADLHSALPTVKQEAAQQEKPVAIVPKICDEPTAETGKEDNELLARLETHENEDAKDQILYLQAPDYEKLKGGNFIYEVATEKGEFVYLIINGKGMIPEEITGKEYL
ncbi:MAG: hypothetical protein PHW04_16245, partial [Candidatus Wallbacteria bacterium]|nr:hypothetical protein [Candidatus Wallbacteria bacterium]